MKSICYCSADLAEEEPASDRPQIALVPTFLGFISACPRHKYTILRRISCGLISQTVRRIHQNKAWGNREEGFTKCIKVTHPIMPSDSREE